MRIVLSLWLKKKKPLSEIPEDEVLPTSIEINGTQFKTDVREIGKLNVLACDSSCNEWQTTSPGNRSKVRPLVGGLSITSTNESGTGTLGFIAVDNDTNALVGVTNNHVIVGHGFNSVNRGINDEYNELNNNVFQPGEFGGNQVPENITGVLMKYVPIYEHMYQYPTGVASIPNQVDGAVFSVDQNDISFSESWRQYGLSYNMPMAFASTSEIDNLMNTNPTVYASGRTTGPKSGTCALKISALFMNGLIGGYNYGQSYALFSDLIEFVRINDDCDNPVVAGDSGSALIADFNGTWKIIGLIFAGSSNSGSACRIDLVANQLNISAWDASIKPFIDVNSKTIITRTGAVEDSAVQCGGKYYWQFGKTMSSNPCT